MASACEKVMTSKDLLAHIITFVPIDYSNKYEEPPYTALIDDPWLHDWFTWTGVRWEQQRWGRKHRQRILDEIAEYEEYDY